MIPAINNFTGGQVIKVNLNYDKYAGAKTINKSLLELKKKSISNLHSKLSKRSNYDVYEIEDLIKETLSKSIFKNKDFLKDFLFNKLILPKEDYLNFSVFFDNYNLNGDILRPLSYLIDSYFINVESYSIFLNYYSKRKFIRVNDYLFYNHTDKMETFILLGIFQLDKEQLIENNSLDINNERSVIPLLHSINNPSCFIPTKDFFDKKNHNFSWLKSKFKLFNIKIIKDTLIDYEIIPPKIDQLQTIKEKVNMLKLVQERASTDTFSTNRRLVLC